MIKAVLMAVAVAVACMMPSTTAATTAACAEYRPDWAGWVGLNPIPDFGPIINNINTLFGLVNDLLPSSAASVAADWTGWMGTNPIPSYNPIIHTVDRVYQLTRTLGKGTLLSEWVADWAGWIGQNPIPSYTPIINNVDRLYRALSELCQAFWGATSITTSTVTTTSITATIAATTAASTSTLASQTDGSFINKTDVATVCTSQDNCVTHGSTCSSTVIGKLACLVPDDGFFLRNVGVTAACTSQDNCVTHGSTCSSTVIGKLACLVPADGFFLNKTGVATACTSQANCAAHGSTCSSTVIEKLACTDPADGFFFVTVDVATACTNQTGCDVHDTTCSSTKPTKYGCKTPANGFHLNNTDVVVATTKKTTKSGSIGTTLAIVFALLAVVGFVIAVLLLQDRRRGRKRAMTGTAATPAGVRRCPGCHAKTNVCGCSRGPLQGGGDGGATVATPRLAGNPMYSPADEAHPAVAGGNRGGGDSTGAYHLSVGSAEYANAALPGEASADSIVGDAMPPQEYDEYSGELLLVASEAAGGAERDGMEISNTVVHPAQPAVCVGSQV
jgi:hypothetical protein